MEPLTGFWSYFGMFIAAVAAGAIGGFAFELMPAQSQSNMGSIRVPRLSQDKALFDMGFLSNILLGAVTAVAVLYFFPPETKTIMANGTASYSYELVKLVALSLIVGSAGPSFLSSIQGRLAGVLNAQREADAKQIDKLTQEHQDALDEHHDEIKRQVTDTIKKMATTVPTAVPSAMGENGNHNGSAVAASEQAVVESTVSEVEDICNTAVKSVKQQFKDQAETAKQEIRQGVGSR